MVIVRGMRKRQTPLTRAFETDCPNAVVDDDDDDDDRHSRCRHCCNFVCVCVPMLSLSLSLSVLVSFYPQLGFSSLSVHSFVRSLTTLAHG